MKCTGCRQQLFAYLEGEVTQGQRMEIETHLLSCARCQEALTLLEEETKTLKRVLNKPALPYDFTEQVIMQLTPYQSASPVTAIEPQVVEHPVMKRRERFGRPRLRQLAVSLILLVCFIVAAGMYISPTFADYLSSFISRFGGEEGLKKAAEQGYSIPVNQAQTSNGTTFRIRDIVADQNRLVVSYILEDKNGKILPDLYIPDYGGNEITLTDKSGKKIYQSRQFNRGGDYADYTFSLHNPPDDVIVHFDIHSYGSKEPIPVQWKLDIPVNLKKSLEASKSEQIGATFESPGGIKFELIKVSFSPSASRLDIATERTAQEKERIYQLAKKVTGRTDERELEALGAIGFNYRIVNEQGETIVHVDGGSERGKRSIYFTSLNHLDDKGRYLWTAAYVSGPASEKLTFILDSVEVQEESAFVIDIQPKQLKKGTITKKYPELNRSYSIKKIRKGVDPDTQKPAWVIDLEAVMPPGDEDFTQQWSLFDDKGTRYETKLDYSQTEMTPNHMKQTIVVPELTKVNGPMKLALQTYWKKYDDFDWKVPIPQEPK